MNGKNRETVLETLPLIRKEIMENFLQPEKYGLVVPKEESSSSSSRLVLILSGLALVALGGLSYFGYSHLKKRKESKENN